VSFFILKGSDNVIIIDAGHGGKDPGAIGPSETKEKDINLEVTKLLSILLDYRGHSVKLTRTEDIYPTWEERVESDKDDLYISIHCNSAPNESAQGIETFHYPSSKQGQELASHIQNNLIALTNRTNRGVKAANFCVLKETRCPAVLAELGFISNEEEERLLRDFDYQLKCAVAIIKAVESYQKSNS
jgi:N-acetylmuramoyl-L-alanine amidase